MSGELSILNFDIFKTIPSVKEARIPEYAHKFLARLQTSLNRIQHETLQKYMAPSDAVPKVMNDLERNLNAIMRRNLLAVKSINNGSKVNLSELYNQSVRHNNAVLKKHLNSMYLTCRVYRELFKDHPVLDNLQLRLISVRCKAIRDICQNETRRGKIRHLRCGSRNPRLVPTVPRRLKSLLKRIHREIEKKAGLSDKDELGVSGAAEDRQALYGALEEAVANYYYRHADGSEVEGNSASRSATELAWNLAELASSNGLDGGNRTQKGSLSDRASSVLQACEQDGVLAALGISTDEVARSFLGSGDDDDHRRNKLPATPPIDRDPLGIVAMESVIEDYDEYVAGVAEDVNGAISGTEDDRIGEDVLDFDNFQLVDVWEEQEPQPQQPLPRDTAVATETTAIQAAIVTATDKSGSQPPPAGRRKRRSRFAPMTDDELATFLLQQQEQLLEHEQTVAMGTGVGGAITTAGDRQQRGGAPQTGHRPGFCSTFVDEDCPSSSSIIAMETASAGTRDVVDTIAAGTAGAAHETQSRRHPIKRDELSPSVDMATVANANAAPAGGPERGVSSQPPQSQSLPLLVPVPPVSQDKSRGRQRREAGSPQPPLVSTAPSPRQPSRHQEADSDTLPDRGDLCKAMLRQFHDSLLQLATATSNTGTGTGTGPRVNVVISAGAGAGSRGNTAAMGTGGLRRRGEWKTLVETVLAPWRVADTAMRPSADSRVPGDSCDMVARQIYRDVEARVADLVADALRKTRPKRRGPIGSETDCHETVAKRPTKTPPVAVASRKLGGRQQSDMTMTTAAQNKDHDDGARRRRQQQQQQQRAPTTDDDSEDISSNHGDNIGTAESARTATSNSTSSNPLATKRQSRLSEPSGSLATGIATASGGSSASPERARLRAMMLSYKRDVEKSREGASTAMATTSQLATTLGNDSTGGGTDFSSLTTGAGSAHAAAVVKEAMMNEELVTGSQQHHGNNRTGNSSGVSSSSSSTNNNNNNNGVADGNESAIDDEECGMAELLSRAATDQEQWGTKPADEHHTGCHGDDGDGGAGGHSDDEDDDDDENEDDDDSEGLASSSSDNDTPAPAQTQAQTQQGPPSGTGTGTGTGGVAVGTRRKLHRQSGTAAPAPASSLLPQQRRPASSTGTKPGTTTSTSKAEISRMQWLVPPPEAVSVPSIPAPATPFLEDSEEHQCWTGKKVFVVDSHDKGSAIALMVKAFLHKNSARVYDTTNYKQAGKDLHVLVHEDWRFPDSSGTGTGTGTGGTGSSSSGSGSGTRNAGGEGGGAPISLLLLKNNSGVHFLSYSDVECVSRFACQTVFPHSRSCIFLDQHALLGTHADNIRNMLDFMIHERHTSSRVWCLKIPGSVYRLFCARIAEKSAAGGSNVPDDAELENLRRIDAVLLEYAAGKPSARQQDESLCLVEIQSGGDEDLASLQEHVLNQQHYLQKKFRHFCILTDSLTATELDIGFLSIYGVAVLPLNTFLVNKTGKYIRHTPHSVSTVPTGTGTGTGAS